VICCLLNEARGHAADRQRFGDSRPLVAVVVMGALHRRLTEILKIRELLNYPGDSTFILYLRISQLRAFPDCRKQERSMQQ